MSQRYLSVWLASVGATPGLEVMMQGQTRTQAIDEDVRTAIVRVATHYFAERGYAATSLQAIADEVGIRKQSVLHYFSTKEHIRQEVLDNLLAHWSETLPRILVVVGGGEDRLETIIRRVIEFFSEDADRARLLSRELLDRPVEMREIIGQLSAVWVKAICDTLRQGQKEGSVFADVNPEAFVLQVVHLIVTGVGMHRVMSVLIDPEADSAESLAAYTEELVRAAKLALFDPQWRPKS